MSLNLDKSTWEDVRFGDVVKHVSETMRGAAAAGIDRVIGLEHLDPNELAIVRWGDDPPSATAVRLPKPRQPPGPQESRRSQMSFRHRDFPRC